MFVNLANVIINYRNFNLFSDELTELLILTII